MHSKSIFWLKFLSGFWVWDVSGLDFRLENELGLGSWGWKLILKFGFGLGCIV